MNLSEHPIVKTKVPFLVEKVLSISNHPKGKEEIILFCQALAEVIIKTIEPVNKN